MLAVGRGLEVRQAWYERFVGEEAGCKDEYDDGQQQIKGYQPAYAATRGHTG